MGGAAAAMPSAARSSTRAACVHLCSTPLALAFTVALAFTPSPTRGNPTRAQAFQLGLRFGFGLAG